MKRLGRYDTDLQMFVDFPRPIDMNHLIFMRWLGERHLLEHDIAGSSSGPFAVVLATESTNVFADTEGWLRAS